MNKALVILAALLSVACQTKMVIVEEEKEVEKIVQKTIRSASTFSSYSIEPFTEADPSEGDGYQFSWTVGDYIAANGVVYKASYCKGQIAMFAPHNPEEEASAKDDSPRYEVVFPHAITTTANRVGKNYLSSTVSYKEGELGRFPIFATTDEDQLYFKNVTGALRLRLKTEEEPFTLTQIRLVANKADGGNSALSDEFIIEDGAAVSTSALVGALVMKPNKTIGTEEEAFGFPVFPGTYPKLTITLTRENGSTKILGFENVTFARSVITTLHATLSFASEGGGQGGGQNDAGTQIEYTSSDGKAVTPGVLTVAKILSNEYADGKGVIILDRVLTQLQAKSFMDCATLKSIVIPATVGKIGNNSFQNCTALEEITLPPDIAELGVNLLNGCALKSITIPSKVEKIGNKALANNKSLKTLDIPESVLLLDTNAFLYDSALESIRVRRYLPDDTEHPITAMNGAGVVQGCTSLQHIYVPAAAVDAYKESPGWSSKASIIEAFPE